MSPLAPGAGPSPLRWLRPASSHSAPPAAAPPRPVPARAGQLDSSPVQVGLVYSKTGPLAAYGAEYLQGFTAGLDYATDGTGKVDGHTIEVAEHDDAGDPAKAVSAATDLIGQGYKILAGSTSSGVGLQVAPLAAQNQVLFISGPAATDALTGITATPSARAASPTRTS